MAAKHAVPQCHGIAAAQSLVGRAAVSVHLTRAAVGCAVHARCCESAFQTDPDVAAADRGVGNADLQAQPVGGSAEADVFHMDDQVRHEAGVAELHWACAVTEGCLVVHLVRVWCSDYCPKTCLASSEVNPVYVGTPDPLTEAAATATGPHQG